MGSLGSVVLLALALVLAAAGVAKLNAARGLSPAAARVIPLATGSLELILAAAVFALPGRLAGILAGLVYGVFTVLHLRDLRAGRSGCDCFGPGTANRTSPLRAAALTGVASAAAVGLAVFGARSPLAAAAHDPGQLPVVIVLGAGAALLWRYLFATGGSAPVQPFTLSVGAGAGNASTRLRPSRELAGQERPERASATLVRASAQFLERRLSRRTVLRDVAVVGSALAVTPVRYLLYPGTAMAAIRATPDTCASGLCDNGYTEFCCQINKHGVNACPEGTFPGGWWMCTDYAGRKLCSEAGVRYYVDCNATPGKTFPGGCHCANDNCDHYRVACNIFRYGQCNTQIEGVTAVVCRLVLCENPSLAKDLNCSASLAVDDDVCAQDAACLEPPAREFAGAGGV